MNNIEAARTGIVETGRKMLASNLVTGTWGNISCRVEGESLIAVTPSGMEYDTLQTSDIVVLDMDGKVVSGDRRPSTELPMHLHIYKNREDVNAIVHTHSTYATALACAHRPVAPIVEELVQVVGGDVRVAKYALPGTSELADNVLTAARSRQAALLANHGMVGMGRTLRETFRICEIVEKASKILILSHMVGQPLHLSFEDVQIMREYYLKHYGQP